MFYHKKSNYPGRWIVKLVEAGLIFGIVLFGLDALTSVLVPNPEPIVITREPVRQEVVIPQQDSTTYADHEYHALALQHHMNDEYYEAILDYNRALALNPHRANSRLNRGVAYEQLGYTNRSIHDFNAYMNRTGTTHIQSVIPYSEYDVNVQMAEGRVYELTFTAKAGQTLNVAVNSVHRDDTEAVDPLIVVVNDEGVAVAGDDDTLRQDGSLITMDSEIEAYTVTESGTYTLRVSHAGGNSYGPVMVDFNLQSASSNAGVYYFGGDCYEEHER